jgi:predicted TIM-barrel fold metal-dependent hydrolase
MRRDPTSGEDFWFIDGRKTTLSVGATAQAGYRSADPKDRPLNFDALPPAAYDPHARLAYLDSIGIWAQVIYPNVGGFGNQGFLDIADRQLGLACVQAYNDWLIEWCAADDRRLVPIMALPFWDLDASVAEIERAAGLGHKGVLFTGEPHRFGLPYFADRAWDRLWAAVQASGLPLSFHLGSGDMDVHLKSGRPSVYGARATSVVTGATMFLENGAQVADFLMSGVLPRFPDLKAVSVESGAGWVPFVLETLDFNFEHYQVWREHPEFTEKPSDYFRRQMYVCYFFEQFAPSRLVDAIGADNLLFETDYPHPVCLYGNVREVMEGGVAGLPADVRHRLVYGNAARLYGVPEPASAQVPVPA